MAIIEGIGLARLAVRVSMSRARSNPESLPATPFSIPAYRRFSVHSFVTTTRALPRPRHRVESFLYRLALTGALPIRRGKTLSLTVTFPNEQRIEISEAVVRWSRGQEFAVKHLLMEPHTHGRIQHDYVKRLVQEQAEIVP